MQRTTVHSPQPCNTSTMYLPREVEEALEDALEEAAAAAGALVTGGVSVARLETTVEPMGACAVELVTVSKAMQIKPLGFSSRYQIQTV